VVNLGGEQKLETVLNWEGSADKRSETEVKGLGTNTWETYQEGN